MLKKEQKVILTLLKELDEICRKEKIEYYLSPRLTRCALGKDAFPENPMCGEVLMKVGEMERFREACEDRLSTGRALESMKSHRWFPGFYLRYEDTRTLCLNLDRGRDYEVPGLGINIYPLRTAIPEGALSRRNDREECGWLQLCGAYDGVRDFAAFCAKMAMKLRSIGGRDRLGEKLYEDFCKRQQNPDADAYVWHHDGKKVVFLPKLFRKTTRVTLAGETFSVPFDTEGYLRAGLGDAYKEGEPLYVEKPEMIVSAYVSWEQFSQKTEGLEQLLAGRVRRNRRRQRQERRNVRLLEKWNYEQFCEERTALGISYGKRKDYIRNLHKNGDFLTLEKVFKPYSKMMQRCLLQDEVFMEDEEIFDIYMDVLQKTGKEVQKNKIRALV